MFKKQGISFHLIAWWHHSVLNIAFGFFHLKHIFVYSNMHSRISACGMRLWQAAKSFFFAFPPPQLHHSHSDIKDLAKYNTAHWFKYGIADGE